MGARHLLAVLIFAAGLIAVLLLRGTRREREHAAVVGKSTATAIEREVGTLEPTRSTDGARSAAHIERETLPALPASGALRVRVVDSAGRPRAGVPIALLADGPKIPLAEEVERRESAHPDGIATFSADLTREALPEGIRFSVAIDLPVEPRVERDLDAWVPGEPWRGGLVELVLGDDDAAWLEPLRVQVVDQRGQPVVGAEVELVARERLAPSDRLGCGEATTRGADGIAEIPRAEQRDLHGRYRMLQIALDYEVCCPGPYLSIPSVAVPTRPSNDPVRIVLPPTATVVARVRRGDGGLVDEDARIGLEWFAPGAERPTGGSEVRIQTGTARFERVGLGLALRLGAALCAASTRPAEVRIAAPSNEGETLEVDLVLGAELPLLAGRLIAENGEPAAGLPFTITAGEFEPPTRGNHAEPLRASSSQHVADSDGRFAIPWPVNVEPLWPASVEPDDRPLRFEEELNERLGSYTAWVPRYAERPFPTLSEDGRKLDVGDVVLEEVPVVVAGRVVDASGAPVELASLHVTGVESERGDARWYVATEADGTFVARSFDRARRLRVSAIQQGAWESKTIEVEPGTRDVRLVLPPAEDLSVTRGRFWGRVFLDEDVPLVAIKVLLTGEANRSGVIEEAGGVFWFEYLVPGTYRLELRTARTEWPLDAIDGIVVRAGETNDDARLHRIDLRGRLRVLRLRLRGDAGVPLASTQVEFGPSRARASLSTDPEGRLIAIVRAEDPSFILSAEGFAPVEIAWSPDEQGIVLVRQ